MLTVGRNAFKAGSDRRGFSLARFCARVGNDRDVRSDHRRILDEMGIGITVEGIQNGYRQVAVFQSGYIGIELLQGLDVVGRAQRRCGDTGGQVFARPSDNGMSKCHLVLFSFFQKSRFISSIPSKM